MVSREKTQTSLDINLGISDFLFGTPRQLRTYGYCMRTAKFTQSILICHLITIKTPAKKSSENSVRICRQLQSLTKLRIETNSVDLSLHCLLERLLKHFRRQQKQMKFVVIGTLTVKTIPTGVFFLNYQQLI